MTLFDILILLALFAGATWGFYRGVFRQAFGTLFIYIAIIISTLGYRSLSKLLSGAGTPTSAGTDMLAFVIWMGVLTLIFSLITNDITKNIDTSRMGMWPQLGGMVFGFINAAIWCAVLLIIIRSATGGERWVGYQGVQTFFQNQVQNSWMAYIMSPFMRFLLILIRPWLFGRDLPRLLQYAL